MKCVAVTGYFRTGSGAVYNLLQEYSSVTDAGLSEHYEHIFLYTINGVFDLIDRILYSNNLFNSNAAINMFRQEMKRLNDNDFDWYGGYKFRYKNEFENIIEEFISDITEYHINRDWYGTDLNRKYTFTGIVKDTINGLIGRRPFNHNYGKRIQTNSYNRGEYSFASKEKLQEATKKLISNYLRMINPNEDKLLILNHMLSPMDAYRLKDYFPEDFYLIIVDRDVRDIYSYNSYLKVWDETTFPKERDEFISFYKKYRENERKTDYDHILRVRYEDLAYKYDSTVKEIEEFLCINDRDHINSKQKFDPQIARKNTQLFNINDKSKIDAEIISIELPNLVYKFPYKEETVNVEGLF